VLLKSCAGRRLVSGRKAFGKVEGVNYQILEISVVEQTFGLPT
jgi:hypothetical protein